MNFPTVNVAFTDCWSCYFVSVTLFCKLKLILGVECCFSLFFLTEKIQTFYYRIQMIEFFK